MNKPFFDINAAHYVSNGGLMQFRDTYIISNGMWEQFSANMQYGGFKDNGHVFHSFFPSEFACPVCGSKLYSADAKGKVCIKLIPPTENSSKGMIDPVGEVFLCPNCRTLLKAPYGREVTDGIVFALLYQPGISDTARDILDDMSMDPEVDEIAGEFVKLVTDFEEMMVKELDCKPLSIPGIPLFEDVQLGSYYGFPLIEAYENEKTGKSILLRAVVLHEFEQSTQPNKEIRISNIHVPAYAKHKGFGKRLVADIYKLAKEYGYRLYIVDMVNGPYSFYERLKRRGARVCGPDILEITDETDLINAVKFEKKEAKFKVGETQELLYMLTAAGALTARVKIKEVSYDEYANRYLYKIELSDENSNMVPFVSENNWYPEEGFII